MNGPPGLLLSYGCSISNVWPAHEITDLEPDEITAPELAVECEIKQGPISHANLALEEEPDRPDLFLLEWSLRSDLRSKIPLHALLSCPIKM